MLKRLWSDEKGQGMVEYGLILALVSIVAILALTSLGEGVRDKFNAVVTNLQ
ncbi:MAG: Flp family type IVb pilin [Bacteroidales bacterium]|jgi:pilus assembly protein Flp/PilA|nr:Flp family type IVb pilin [Bacteroidales bacterium]